MGKVQRFLPDDPLEYNKGYLYKQSKKPEFEDKKAGATLTIAVDWMDLFCTAEIRPDGSFAIPTVKEAIEDYPISENIILRKYPYGTPMYLNCFLLIYQGLEFATIQTHPRLSTGSFRPNSFNIKLQNHILYQSDWMENLVAVLAEMNGEVQSVTRLDIAIDGPNYLPDFLNYYLKQEKENKAFHMKGKSTFNCMQQNHETMDFKRFQIGSSKSDKQFAVYCKSKEIETSNKKYIQRYWENCGLHFPEGQEVYRVELRMKSKAVNDIEDFDFTNLAEPDYLASIFKTHAHNCFEFAYVNSTDSNNRRYETIELIDYDKLGGRLLTKTQRAQVTHRYKAKLSLHVNCFALLSGIAKIEERVGLVDSMVTMLINFDLLDWFKKKLPEWQSKYDKDRKHIQTVKRLEQMFEPVEEVF